MSCPRPAGRASANGSSWPSRTRRGRRARRRCSSAASRIARTASTSSPIAGSPNSSAPRPSSSTSPALRPRRWRRRRGSSSRPSLSGPTSCPQSMPWRSPPSTTSRAVTIPWPSAISPNSVPATSIVPRSRRTPSSWPSRRASDRVVGYASLFMLPGSTTRAYHDMTAVLREQRGRGIARALKAATIALGDRARPHDAGDRQRRGECADARAQCAARLPAATG